MLKTHGNEKCMHGIAGNAPERVLSIGKNKRPVEAISKASSEFHHGGALGETHRALFAIRRFSASVPP